MKYFEIFLNENTSYQNVWGVAKVSAQREI